MHFLIVLIEWWFVAVKLIYIYIYVCMYVCMYVYTLSVTNGGGGVAAENWWSSGAKLNERAMITMASIGHHEIEGGVDCGGFL